MYRRIYELVRDAIEAETLPAGVRLPSSRTLSKDLGVSRNTITNAFELLFAHGYVESRVGDGTYVSERVLTRPAAVEESDPAPQRRLGEKADSWLEGQDHSESSIGDFDTESIAVDLFPSATWSRCLAQCAREEGVDLLGPDFSAGYEPLRTALCHHLVMSRGLRCHPDQIVLLSSARQGIDVASRVLAAPGAEVWIEDPGEAWVRRGLLSAGRSPVSVACDERGMNVARGRELAPQAALAVVHPASSFPIGVTLEQDRREALTSWAEETSASLLDVDADSDLIHDGRPKMTLYEADSYQRTLYLGTLSRVMFPSIRLAYFVAPKDLVSTLVAARNVLDGAPSPLIQAAMARFIDEGTLGAHVRRLRQTYREREVTLASEMERAFGGAMRRFGRSGGPYQTYLFDGVDDVRLADRASHMGLKVGALSTFTLGDPRLRGLVLGYGGLCAQRIPHAVERLAKAWREVQAASPFTNRGQ